MRFERLKVCLAVVLVSGAAAFQAPAAVWAAGPGESGGPGVSSGGPGDSGGPGVSQDGSAEEQQKNPYAWERVNGTYQMENGSPISGVYARGIDVSQWQGDIDWKKVAADDVSFVMLGTRYDGKLDPKFHQNIQGALNNGVQVGAYIYSYATTPEMASAEADFVLNAVSGYHVTYPLVFDVEATVMRSLSKDQLTEIIHAFCSKIQAAGYETAVYANEYWLYNLLDMSSVPYDVWVARYGVPYTYENPYMWQATNTGSIEGIQGNVDIDFQFKASPNGTRTSDGGPGVSSGGPGTSGSQGSQSSGSGPAPVGGPGADAGSGGNGSGQAQSPAPAAPDGSSAGWKEEGGVWHYYGPSGNMITGWLQDNGQWYYLDFDGSMETGWTMVNEKWYYLKSSGQMVIGWRQIDGSWYYFDGSGAMARGWLDLGGVRYYLDENGRMKAGESFTVDGVTYRAAADGSCIQS